MELDVRVAKTFYDWCIENNRIDLNDRFDEDKNGCTTKDIGYKSNLKYWFRCPNGVHESVDNGITLCTKCHDATEQGSLHHIYGTHDITPDMLRKYIFDKSNKDIYITNPNLLYQIPLLSNEEFEFN